MAAVRTPTGSMSIINTPSILSDTPLTLPSYQTSLPPIPSTIRTPSRPVSTPFRGHRRRHASHTLSVHLAHLGPTLLRAYLCASSGGENVEIDVAGGGSAVDRKRIGITPSPHMHLHYTCTRLVTYIPFHDTYTITHHIYTFTFSHYISHIHPLLPHIHPFSPHTPLPASHHTPLPPSLSPHTPPSHDTGAGMYQRADSVIRSTQPARCREGRRQSLRQAPTAQRPDPARSASHGRGG